MPKLLITGASGFLGWNLCQIAHQNYNVYGTYYSRSIEDIKINSSKIDLANYQELKQLFGEIKPNAVIHLAAQSSPNFCQNYPEESHAINVTASSNIAGLCADFELPCVFTSTDLVFNGLNPPYRETDPVSPINRYGEQKVMAEQLMLQRYPKTAICRMPLMFGLAPNRVSSFIQPFIKTLREGKELNLFTDEVRTPVSGKTASAGLLLALEKVQGIIHLGGSERTSRYQFGQLMSEILELPTSLIKPCLQKDVPMSAARSPDVSLDSSKAFSLGYHPPSLREELEALRGKV